MATLLEMGEELRSVAERTRGTVVGIANRWARGSGIVLDDGLVLTNAHNVRSEDLEVHLPDGRRTAGRPRAVDADGDLAVIEADTTGAKAIAWGDASEIAIGTPVFAAANPAGLGLRVTVGFVSGVQRAFPGPRGRLIRGSLEHTAPLLPGSSGGPLVEGSGRLLGVNTNRLGEGFYLAIPATTRLRERVDGLRRGESPTAQRIGVAVAPSHIAKRLRRAVGLEEAEGILVRGVEEESPARTAGIREGDLVVGAGDVDVRSPEDLHEAISRSGGTLELRLLRGSESITVEVRLPR